MSVAVRERLRGPMGAMQLRSRPAKGVRPGGRRAMVLQRQRGEKWEDSAAAGEKNGRRAAWVQMEVREVEKRHRVWVMAEEGAGWLVSMHPPRVQVKPRPRQSACGRIALHITARTPINRPLPFFAGPLPRLPISARLCCATLSLSPRVSALLSTAQHRWAVCCTCSACQMPSHLQHPLRQRFGNQLSTRIRLGKVVS